MRFLLIFADTSYGVAMFLHVQIYARRRSLEIWLIQIQFTIQSHFTDFPAWFSLPAVPWLTIVELTNNVDIDLQNDEIGRFFIVLGLGIYPKSPVKRNSWSFVEMVLVWVLFLWIRDHFNVILNSKHPESVCSQLCCVFGIPISSAIALLTNPWVYLLLRIVPKSVLAFSQIYKWCTSMSEAYRSSDIAFKKKDNKLQHITNICAFLADGNKKAEAKCNEVFSDEFTNMAKNFISSNVSDHVCKRLALCWVTYTVKISTFAHCYWRSTFPI